MHLWYYRGSTKEEAAEKHLEFLDGLPNSTLVVYSDGSQDGVGNIGWEAVTFHKARATKARATKARGSLANAEVYDAEAVGSSKHSN